MDLAKITTQQKAFFRSGQTRDWGFRIRLLAKLEQVIELRREEILAALGRDLGKPLIEAYLSEVFFVKKEIQLFRKRLRQWVGAERVGAPFYHFPVRSEIRREPFGRALIISPWNYPFQLAVSPLIAAVAAGNCVIVKPSEAAPATAQILRKIAAEVFAPEHVEVLTGGMELSQSLLAEKFDIIFFTGSEKVGRLVAKAAAEHLTPVILELGGKCPVVVDREVNIGIAANRIVAAKFFNSGQTCFAPDFVVVHQEIRDDLITEMIRQLESFYPEGNRADLARILNPTHFERLTAMIEGEEWYKHGSDDPETLFFAPTIIKHADWESTSMQEEIFGPLLPVLAYSSPDSLIEKLQAMPAPLALYLFSKNQAWVEQLMAAVPSGGVGINDLMKQSSNLALPFGGVGRSGMGRYRGKFGFDAFTYQQAVSRRWLVNDFFSIQPPYAGKLERFRKFLK
jgi:aldehyde dehydrogenase (NAD+)